MYVDKKEKNVSQKKNNINKTGIPIQMKNFFEYSSGMSLDDVKVHYHSQKPMLLNAHAYTQGNQVYITNGQERYLGHELTHVIQQKQGRVKPINIMNGMYINNDADLEKEADTYECQNFQNFPHNSNIQNVIQAKLIDNNKELKTEDEIRTKIAELEIIIPEEYETRIIGVLLNYVKAKKDFPLEQSLIDSIIQNIKAKEAKVAEVAKQEEIYQKALELYLHLKNIDLENISANALVIIFKDFGFKDSCAEISQKSSVLANVIVRAKYGEKEYLYVEIHPKGGIHYGSYILVNLETIREIPISKMPPKVRVAVPSPLKGRYKLVLSKPSRYLGQQEENKTTDILFLQYGRQWGASSELSTGKYHHDSIYINKQLVEKESKDKSKTILEMQSEISAEGRDFLKEQQARLFEELPIHIRKSQDMLHKGYWDEMLYYSVHIMRNKKEIQMLKKQCCDDMRVHLLEIEIHILENKINILKLRLKVQTIRDDLNRIKTELNNIGEKLNDIEQRTNQIRMNFEKDTEEVL